MSINQRALAWSLVISGTSCALPYLFPPAKWDAIVRISLWLGLAWLATLIIFLVRYRKKGLWYLVGAPLALYWPFILFMIVWACGHDVHQCP